MRESGFTVEDTDPGMSGHLRIRLLEVRLRAAESLVRIMLPSHVTPEKVDTWTSLFDEVHSQIVSASAIEEVYQDVVAEIARNGPQPPDGHPR
jgi:hypothetical protein